MSDRMSGRGSLEESIFLQNTSRKNLPLCIGVLSESQSGKGDQESDCGTTQLSDRWHEKESAKMASGGCDDGGPGRVAYSGIHPERCNPLELQRSTSTTYGFDTLQPVVPAGRLSDASWPAMCQDWVIASPHHRIPKVLVIMVET